MTVELTPAEAEILIAVLTFAEGAALVNKPGLTAAIAALRPWRTALLQQYMRAPTALLQQYMRARLVADSVGAGVPVQE